MSRLLVFFKEEEESVLGLLVFFNENYVFFTES